MSCSAAFCSSRKSKYPELSFHLFPKHPEVRREWIKAVGRGNWEPMRHSRLCSKHFEKTCFIEGLTYRMLKWDAIPTIFEGSSEHYQTLENDMENYMKHKLVGGRLKLKKDVVPHKFACQEPFLVEPGSVKAQLQNKLKPNYNHDTASTSYHPEQMYIGHNSMTDQYETIDVDLLDDYESDIKIKDETNMEKHNEMQDNQAETSDELLMCRGCFATGVKLLDLKLLDLKSTFEEFVGKTEVEEVGHWLCLCCATLLIKFTQFRYRCRRAENLLQVLREDNTLNASTVKSVDRSLYKLNTHLSISQTFIDTNILPGEFMDKESNINIKVEKEGHGEFHKEECKLEEEKANTTFGEEEQIVKIEESEIKQENPADVDPLPDYVDDRNIESTFINKRKRHINLTFEEDLIDNIYMDYNRAEMESSQNDARNINENLLENNYDFEVGNLSAEQAQSGQIGRNNKRICKRPPK